MRIAYLSESTIPSRMANSVQVMKMCAAFTAAGAEVTLYARPGRWSTDADLGIYYGVASTFGVVISFFAEGWRGRTWIYGALTAWRAWRSRPSAAYCRCLSSARGALTLGLPVFLELHAVPLEGSTAHRRLTAVLRHKRFAGVVAITHALAHDLRVAYGLAESQLLVAADGADEVLGLSILPKRSGKRLSVGYMGHLYPGKGMEIVVPLARLCAWADFHVVGGTPEWIEHWRHEAAGCPNLFFHGFVPPSETGRYIAEFDIVLLPNQTRVASSGGGDIGAWTSPLKLFEYMAYGRAILASDLTVLREVLIHEGNCLLCPADDPAGWEQALRRLDSDPALCTELGQRAQTDFLAKYTWRQRARNIMNFMKNRLGGS